MRRTVPHKLSLSSIYIYIYALRSCCQAIKRLLSKRKIRCSLFLTSVELSYHVRLFQVKLQPLLHGTSCSGSNCPAVEGLPVLDAALHVFLTLPGHTSIREDERQPVVERVEPGRMDAESKYK
jgi:hypothetical protein